MSKMFETTQIGRVKLAERLIDEGYGDYISMSRAFIREPDLVNRRASWDLRKAGCVSDNQCFEPFGAGDGIYRVIKE